MEKEHKRLEVPFTQVANVVLNNKKLSLKAKGLFAYIYSKPSGWNFSADRIAEQSEDGVSSVLAGLYELEVEGYLIRNKLASGRTEYLLSYEPNPENRILGKSQIAEIAPLSNKERTSNKEISETFVSQPSRSQSLTVEEVDEDGNPIARVWRSKRVIKVDRDWSWESVERKLANSPLAIDKLCLRYIRRKGLVFNNQGHWELERVGMLKIAKEFVKAGVNAKVFDAMCDMAEEVKEDWTIHTTRGFLTKALQGNY